MIIVYEKVKVQNIVFLRIYSSFCQEDNQDKLFTSRINFNLNYYIILYYYNELNKTMISRNDICSYIPGSYDLCRYQM